MLINKNLFWLEDSTAASQSEAMLEKPGYLIFF